MSAAIATWPDLPRSVLAALLDLAGPPGPMSPRHLLGPPGTLTAAQVVELYAADIFIEPRASRHTLSPEFAKIADTLLAPRLNLTWRAFRPDGVCLESNVLFPGPAFDRAGVALNQIGTCYRLAAFADDKTLLEQVRVGLPLPGPDPAVHSFEALLDPVQALALAAIIDISAVPDGSGVAVPTQIESYLRDSWGLTGFDGLLTYVHVTAAQAAPPDRERISAALTGLAALDLVAAAPDGVGLVPGATAAPLAALVAGNVGGFQWQRVSNEADGLLISDRLFLFGASGAALALTRGTRGRVHLAITGRADVVSFVAGELATAAVAAPAPKPPQDRPAARRRARA